MVAYISLQFWSTKFYYRRVWLKYNQTDQTQSDYKFGGSKLMIS
jgi:hypothetical protein